jgi:16S rRNA (cytidine(1402)-2'-O)-methyltransferase
VGDVSGAARTGGTLYLVGTPIGNLSDITERARQTLAAVDVVAAEDTRRTGTLLKRLGVSARMVSLHDANEGERTEVLLRELRDGRDVAVVSDAGMPLVSDPGFPLVRAAVNEGIDVRVIPGPSAVIAALVGSGLPADRFVFEGFLPRGAGDRRARLASLAGEPRTVVLFESPNRTAAADKPFTITFDNNDAGTPHNVDILGTGDSELFNGELVTGVDQKVYLVTALHPGTYRFRCEVHPSTMQGTFIVK